MNIDKIASKIFLAYGFHTYEQMKEYLTKHPKADKAKHWVEDEKGNKVDPKKLPTKVMKKFLPQFDIPQSVSGKETEGKESSFSVANSAFMKRDENNVATFYVKGKAVVNPDHIKKLIERAKAAVLINTKKYTNIRINAENLDSDSMPDILAIATNPDWKPSRKLHKLQRDDQPCVMIRSPKSMEKSKLKVMVNNTEFTKAVPALYSNIQKGLDAKSPAAAVLYMMTEFGVRPGTLGTKNYGALTLHRKYVHDEGNQIRITNMPMKHDNRLNCVITDPRVLEIFRASMKAGDALETNDKRKNFVFMPTVTSKQVDEMFAAAVGPAFTQKNIRTYIASKTAKDMMDEFFFNEGVGEKMSLANRYNLMKKISKVVSKLIHNQPSMSFGSYIDPVIFEPLGIELVWSENNPYEKAVKQEKKQKLMDKKQILKQKNIDKADRQWNGYTKALIKKLKEKAPAKLKEFKKAYKQALIDSNEERSKQGLPEKNILGFGLAKQLYSQFKV